MKHMFNKLAKILFTLPMVGCSSGPEVSYQRAPDAVDSDVTIRNATEGGDLFAMPLSKIVVASSQSATVPSSGGARSDTGVAPAQQVAGSGKAKNGVVPPSTVTKPNNELVEIGGEQFSVSVVPVEGPKKYIAKPARGFWSTTELDITKIPNTDIPKSVATQFTDSSKTRIDEAAGIITAAIALAPILAAESEQDRACRAHPPKLAQFTLTISGEIRDSTPIEDQPCWSYTVNYVDKTPTTGAISWEKFERENKDSVGYFPIPACRDVKLNLIGYAEPSRDGEPSKTTLIATIATRIADPEYIRLAPLPAKGQITMHPICGADISGTSVDRFASYFDDLSEVLKQAKAIDDALGAKKKSSAASKPGNK